MSIVITVTYKDIFGSETPDLGELIKKENILFYLSAISKINTEILYSSLDITKQFEILKTILIRQNNSTKRNIIEKIIHLERKISGRQLVIFSRHINLYVTHHLLSNYTIIPNEGEITIEEDLDFFKIYLIFSNLISEKIVLRNDTISRIDDFRKNMWPIHVNQIESQSLNNIVTAFLKGKAFFDFTMSTDVLNGYVKNHLEKYNAKNSNTYLWTIFSIIKNSLVGKSSFIIKTTKEIDIFFKKISIDNNYYISKYRENKKNFEGIKSRPLLHHSENIYLVLDWDFFSTKLCEGFYFDFYTESGVSHDNNFKNLFDFKSFIGFNFVEKYLFRRIVGKIFWKRHSIVKFENNIAPIFPDAYVRINNKIFIFEIKDALFPAHTIEKGSYEEIKDVVDTKYNSNKKGTSQLVNAINYLREESLEGHSYETLKIKQRNLIIFPILIYTDIVFSTPGFLHYLQEEFNNKVDASGFKKIEKLSFINLDFLLSNISDLNSAGSIESAIVQVLNKQATMIKKFNRSNNIDDLNSLNMNFEDIYYSINKNTTNGYVDFIFNEFDFLSDLLKTNK